MHDNFDSFGLPQDINYSMPKNIPLEDDDPNNTEVRQTKLLDLATLESIEVKCQDTPLSRQCLTDLLKDDEVHGIVGVYRFQNVGFSLFNVEENGAVVNLRRLSVAYLYRDLGVYEKLIEVLRTTLPSGPPPKLKTMVSEHDLDTDHFHKLVSLGFRGVGLQREAFFEWNRSQGRNTLCDGILLELP